MTTPWALAKETSSRKQLQVVIYNLLEGLRIISGLVYPIMPDTAKTMQDHLGMDSKKPFYNLDILKAWKTLTPWNPINEIDSTFPQNRC